MKNKKINLKKEKIKMLSLLSFLVLAGCIQKPPVIHSIYPQIGRLGEPITVTGAFFGSDRNESYVTIAGVQPTNRAYLTWNDNEITLRIPELREAGLIYVYVKGKKSNGALFANQATVPVQVRDESGTGPRVISVTPNTGAIGALVNISGTGFGSSRGNSGVFFTWNAQASASAPAEARLPEYTEVSETDFGYELWTDREIRIRVPDGAVGGNMEIRTARGTSSPMIFDISGKPGTKTLSGKRSYTISYTVNVKVGDAQTPNTLYLWIPYPVVSSSQRNMELLLSSMEPFVESYRGVSLYKLDNLTANSEAQIRISWKVDVYSVETAIQPQSIRVESNSPISETYTQNILPLPADDPRIKEKAAAIVGRERNPYVKAQRVYEWMTGSELVWESQTSGDIFGVLQTNRTDAYLSALLYCTLLRAAGVPCQPVAGVLVSRSRQTMNHYWAEFWIDGIGWIPVDPAMGAGAVSAPFAVHEERANYHFGNIDSQRIAFSRGYTILSPMDPRGRTVTHSRSYSLQNLREEVIGGIESYSSLWGDITITGIYVQ